MYCRNCGFKNSDEHKFCRQCGHELTVKTISNFSNQSPLFDPTSSDATPEEPLNVDSGNKGLFIISAICLVAIAAVIGILFFGTNGINIFSSRKTQKTKIETKESSKSQEKVTSNNKTPLEAALASPIETDEDATANIDSPDYEMFPNSSSEILSKSDLYSITSAWKASIARNEIYARHGYIFKKNKKIKKYFESKNWYSHDSSFRGADSELNSIEIQNREMISNIESERGWN